ncbi:hypothetical protein CQ047_06030, partial [Microbacterium sp. MYb72]
LGPDSQQTTVKVEEPAPFVMLDGDVLRQHPGMQTLIVQGGGDIFAAYGRTADMKAWLADTSYNHVTVQHHERSGLLDLDRRLLRVGTQEDGSLCDARTDQNRGQHEGHDGPYETHE